MQRTEATNAKGETIKFHDVIHLVENFESEQDDPGEFFKWLNESDHRMGGLIDWLNSGDFEDCVNAEEAAREWIYEVLIDAFWNETLPDEAL